MREQADLEALTSDRSGHRIDQKGRVCGAYGDGGTARGGLAFVPRLRGDCDAYLARTARFCDRAKRSSDISEGARRVRSIAGAVN
ncbi:hypothetical protein GCM10010471_26850 [Leucobacter komagatae]